MQSGFEYNRLRFLDYTRVVSFTLEALELEMQSGIIVQQAEALKLERVAFTLVALELEMQSCIKV